jgi:hypothetical protein
VLSGDGSVLAESEKKLAAPEKAELEKTSRLYTSKSAGRKKFD